MFCLLHVLFSSECLILFMMCLLFRSLCFFFFLILKTRYVHFLLLGFNISLRKSFSLKITRTILYISLIYIMHAFASLYNRGVPGGPSSEEPACQSSTLGASGPIPGREDPLDGVSQGRRTPVFLPGASHGQRNPRGHRVRHNRTT